MQCALSAYIDAALDQARYDKLDDGTYAGEIGVISPGSRIG